MKRLLPFLLLLASCAKDDAAPVRVEFKTFCHQCVSVATVNGTEVYRDTVLDAAVFDRLCEQGDVIALRSTAIVPSDTAVMVALLQNGEASGLTFDQPLDSLITVDVKATVTE